MALLGGIIGAIAGAGSAVADIAKTDQAQINERAALQTRADLEEQKTARIEEARAIRQRQAGIKQGQEIGAEKDRLSREQDANLINEKFGSTATPNDVAVLQGNAAARKAYGLDEPDRLAELELRAKAAENLGYLDAAKETRGLIQSEIQNIRNESNDETRNRQVDLQIKIQAETMKRNAALDAQRIQLEKARMAALDAKDQRDIQREMRNATKEALRGVGQNISSLEKELSSVEVALDPVKKKSINDQIASLRADSSNLIRTLTENGLGQDKSKKPEKEFNPDNYIIGGSAKPSQTVAAQGVSQGLISQSAPDAEQKNQEEIASRLQRVARQKAEQEAYNRVFGSTRREEAIQSRQSDFASQYADKINSIRPGMSRDEKFNIASWIDENAQFMDNSQIKQIRELRAKAGF